MIEKCKAWAARAQCSTSSFLCSAFLLALRLPDGAHIDLKSALLSEAARGHDSALGQRFVTSALLCFCT